MADITILIQTENRPSASFKYVTGLNLDFGIAIIQPRKKTIVYVSSLEKKIRKKDLVVREWKGFEELLKHIKKSKAKNVFLDFTEVSKKTTDNLKKKIKLPLKDCSSKYKKLREIKSTKEVNKIKKAVKITEKLFKELFKKIKTVKTEHELVVWLKKRMIDFGVKPSFEPIIASGKNSKNPHYYCNEKEKLHKGFCVIDMGVIYKNYCSDMTRTVFLGTPSKEQKNKYSSVLNELLRFEKTLKPNSKNIKPSFKMVHALGHSLGLEVHESPILDKATLKEGMVFAVEPAIYDKKEGIRIEDNYLVTKNGLKRLGNLSRKLIILKS